MTAGELPATPVATKLAAPVPVPWLLPRTDLVTQLSTTHAKLCLISAPAGWGKTSLLAAWHEARATTTPLAFLQLEPADDDPPTFWSYVIAALRTVRPTFMAEAAEALRRPGTEPMRRIVPSLVNELAALDQAIGLVLDDYHVVRTEAIHASILYLVDHLPPAVRLVIATRADPPLPLGRLRASGDMAEVRAGRLGLTEEEASLLLNGRFALNIDSKTVQLLCRRTEGWPAALHLAALSLQGETDRPRFVERFAGDDRNIVDYLTTEVLQRLPLARKAFLLNTSVLERLTGPLCDTVAEVSDSTSTLEELERANMFLLPLDNQRTWYRYHHLFGEWLRHELRKTNPEVVPDLHLRASRWYEDHGLLEPGISHAIAAGGHDRAGRLIDRYLTDWAQVNWSAVRRWLRQLPDETVERHPMAVVGKIAFAWMRGDFASGMRWMPAAQAAIPAAPPDLRPAIETMVALFETFGELVAGDLDAARRGFVEIAKQERPAASDAFALAIGNAGIAAFWSVGALEAIPMLQESAVAREQQSLPDTGTTALLAAAYAEIGDWRAAEDAARSALAIGHAYEDDLYPHEMPAHYALGKALLARGERKEGIAEIGKGLALARGWVEPIFIAYGCLALAEALDGYTEKRALVTEARQLIEDGRGRGRIGDLVAVAELKLSLRQPSDHTTGTVHVEPLTARERDVVRLLDSELSLREIANELYLSHNTVKGHTKAIYRKLGVSSRAAAIETARDLDVL